MRLQHLPAIVVLALGVAEAQADLISAFNGYQTVWEPGVSGLQSSYYQDVVDGKPFSGPTVSGSLPILGPDRVSYPSGVGPSPSPGGAMGLNFDQGALGVRVENGQLMVQLATALDPRSGFYHSGQKAWYGQGDVFLDVRDSGGIRHFALLSAWARDGDGDPINYNRGHYNKARTFHISGNQGGSSLEGFLVEYLDDNDVRLAGGRGSYNPNHAPTGLDLRTFVQDGAPLADAGLVHDTLTDAGRAWYLQRWSVGLDTLSPEAYLNLALHSAASCGNDQIGELYDIPEPAGLAALALLGIVVSRVGRAG